VSPQSTSIILTAASLLVIRAEQAFAHGDLHGQIATVSAQIEKEPHNADLFLRRGELRRLHSEFPEAAADLEKAGALQPDSPQVALAKSRLALSTGKFEAAASEMDQLLPKHPEYPEGWLLRARARNQLGRQTEAAKDYTEIIGRVERPEPEIFLERAAALVGVGEQHFDEALRGLNEGLTKLGPAMTLELAALDVELKMKRFDDALRRVDRLAASAKRQESWFARRGDILVQASRPNEARIAFNKALEAIKTLPPHIQATQATTNLKQRIAASLSKLDGAQH
jgi:predicted Zn-dependent protease